MRCQFVELTFMQIHAVATFTEIDLLTVFFFNCERHVADWAHDFGLVFIFHKAS